MLLDLPLQIRNLNVTLVVLDLIAVYQHLLGAISVSSREPEPFFVTSSHGVDLSKDLVAENLGVQDALKCAVLRSLTLDVSFLLAKLRNGSIEGLQHLLEILDHHRLMLDKGFYVTSKLFLDV